MSWLEDMESIGRKHDSLYGSMLKDGSAFLGKGDERQRLETILEEADKLLADIENIAVNVTSLKEYAWLNNMVMNWQLLFASLNIPKDIKVLPIPKQLVTSSSDQTNQHIFDQLRHTAYSTSQIRKLMKLKNDSRFLDELLPSTKEDMDKDWYRAEIYLSSEILNGEKDFVYQMRPDCYHYLEEVWLKDLKKLNAYRAWERKWGTEYVRDPEGDYYMICQKLLDQLFGEDIKASKALFEEVKDYIESRYLFEGRVDQGKYDAKKLIETKAYHIWKASSNKLSSRDCWLLSEAYVKNFYENIIPSVLNDDQENILKVMKAFRLNEIAESYSLVNNPQDHDLAANCFEAAIIIYFLNPSKIKDTGDLIIL
jgi:hypothetical protein